MGTEGKRDKEIWKQNYLCHTCFLNFLLNFVRKQVSLNFKSNSLGEHTLRSPEARDTKGAVNTGESEDIYQNRGEVYF